MYYWKFVLVLLFSHKALSAPSDTSTPKNSEKGGDSSEDSIPGNMNVADYYYSIFGKHLDYDYSEPILTFAEQEHNNLSDDIESEVDKNSPDDVLWNLPSHNRNKRFIFSANFYNNTRRWAQNMQKRRMERMRIRNQRREQRQRNRVNYLNARADALRKQATRLSQLQQTQQRQQVVTRSVPPAQQNTQTKNSPLISTNANTASTPSLSDGLILSESKHVPVKQVTANTT